MFLNISGYHFLYILRRMELKQSMKEYLLLHPESESITEFRFPLDNSSMAEMPEWENSHEFWFNGELYDLVEKRTEKNQLVIRCINDKKESAVVKMIEKIDKENRGDATSKSKSAFLLKVVHSFFISGVISTIHKPGSLSQFSHFNVSYTFPANREVLTPPPRQEL